MKVPPLSLLLIASTIFARSGNASWGSYQNRPLSLQDMIPPDGRRFSLIHEFNYLDQNGRLWPSPQGLITDGASIPMPFWSVIGGPFEGLYREAAIVHDAGCCAQMAKWEDVHHMFYNAMRCSGVGWVKAKTMFFAVWAGGPRWTKLNTEMPAKCLTHRAIDSTLQSTLMQVIKSRTLSASETKAVARPFFTTKAMTGADAAALVAQLKQRNLNADESYIISLSVIQSAHISDADVKVSEAWVEKENPSLEAIERRAEQLRNKSGVLPWTHGLDEIIKRQSNVSGSARPVPTGADFFADVPALSRESL
jgi:hypothetical protein